MPHSTYKVRVHSVINYTNKLVVNSTHKTYSHHPNNDIKISVYKVAARFSYTAGTVFTWLRILYMCTSVACIGCRVKSRRILKRVVAGIAKKFDEFVLI